MNKPKPLSTMIFFFILYVFFVVLAASYGSNKKLGGGMTLLIAILLTPLLAFLFAMVSGDKEEEIKFDEHLDSEPLAHATKPSFEEYFELGEESKANGNKEMALKLYKAAKLSYGEKYTEAYLNSIDSKEAKRVQTIASIIDNRIKKVSI